MTSQNTLEIKGTLQNNPFSELIVEIGQAKLDGSLRVSDGDKKRIFYFREGKLVFAASNAREHRLLNLLVEKGKIEKSRVAELPKVSNDIELAGALTVSGLLSKATLDEVVISQIENIIISCFELVSGQWEFNPMVRSRADLQYPIEVNRILIDHARSRSQAEIFERFKSMSESFEALRSNAEIPYLQSHESFILQRISGSPTTLDQLKVEGLLPENGLLIALYVLWLGGIVKRSGWNSAFSEHDINSIKNARLSLVKPAQRLSSQQSSAMPEADKTETIDIKAENKEVKTITLEEYLDRVEKGATYYDMLGVDHTALTADIKTAYFSLAKQFHPDRYHRERAEIISRIQKCFSSVQQAYETLKSKESRETYDYKNRKELEMKEKLRAQGVEVEENSDDSKNQSTENFELGLSLFLDGEFERSVPFLGRAAHFAPDKALYRAYYGKALSYNDKQRHKAESEMQAGVKLDPSNPKIRMMLVDFFMQVKLLKRAEGELTRFLEIVPNNSEARSMLAKLQSG